MTVLDRSALEESPLADLHAIASELSIDGYRRMRKSELIDTIIERQGGAADGTAAAAPDEPAADEAPPEPERPAPRRRGRRRKADERAPAAAEEASGAPDAESRAPDPESGAPDAESGAPDAEPPREQTVEGVVELLPNGSGFVRVNPPDPSDDDIYISSAQVRRCELVSGDRVTGPRRPPRRSERFAALVRIDTVNGRPAAELADSARYDDLPAEFPTEQFALESAGDPTIEAIASLAPIGKGSRVTIAGGAQAGKTETLRRLTGILSGHEGLALWLVLAGVRAEEIEEWRRGPVAPATALNLAASAEAQAQAVEGTIEQARRIAARGVDAVVVIDTLEGLPEPVGRRALAAARNLVDGGSLTVIATSGEPLGGETTVIGLDRARVREGRFPAIDPDATWTMRRERLTGAAE